MGSAPGFGRRAARAIAAGAAAVLLGAGLVGCASGTPGGPRGGGGEVYVEREYFEIGDCPFPSAPSPVPDILPADPVAATEALALDPGEFWAFVESITASTSDDPFDEALVAMTGCDLDRLRAWEARLTLVLSALDGPDRYEALAARLGADRVDDEFLVARCSTVLAGRDVWSAALADGTLPGDPRGWGDDEAAFRLVGLGRSAATRQHVDAGDYLDTVIGRIPLSTDSRSNPTLWG
jgi:hypothetical protein